MAGLAPVHEQTAATDPRARIWRALLLVASIVTADCIATGLDLPKFPTSRPHARPSRLMSAEAASRFFHSRPCDAGPTERQKLARAGRGAVEFIGRLA